MVTEVFQSHAASLGDRPDSVTDLLRSYTCYGDMPVSASYLFQWCRPFGVIAPNAIMIISLSMFSILSAADEGFPETRHAH